MEQIKLAQLLSLVQPHNVTYENKLLHFCLSLCKSPNPESNKKALISHVKFLRK